VTKLLPASAAGLILALAIAASAAAAPTVKFRVEGKAATLQARTAVKLLDAAEPNTGCAGNSGSAALELGTQGNWDRKPYTQKILGETHDFSQNSDYWGLWVFRGGRYVASNGACDERLAEGEEFLAAYQEAPPANNYAAQIMPMWVEGVPATVAPGRPFTVTVYETICENGCVPGDGKQVVRPGATVTGASVPTDDQGRATVTLTQGGETGVRATRAGNTPSATETTCATTGSDGLCGTVKPPPPCIHDGDDGRCGTRDRKAPQARIEGIAEQQRFAAGKAPRELHGTVAADQSGVMMVKLRLTRRYRGHCEYLSGRQERFRRTPCGRSAPFKIGESADWSYLLPAALKPGRYVLDVIVIDRAFNRDTPARGRNRIVFFVA
jgi:hypothetical protein